MGDRLANGLYFCKLSFRLQDRWVETIGKMTKIE